MLALFIAVGPALAKGEKKGGPIILRDGSGTVFLPMESFNITTFRDTRTVSIVTMQVMLELSSEEVIDRIDAVKTRLRDYFLRDMHAVNAKPRAPGQPLNIVLVKERLKATSNRILGPGTVRDVLVQSSIERENVAIR